MMEAKFKVDVTLLESPREPKGSIANITVLPTMEVDGQLSLTFVTIKPIRVSVEDLESIISKTRLMMEKS